MVWQSSFGNFLFWHSIEAIMFLPLFKYWNKFIVFNLFLSKNIPIQQIFSILQPVNIKYKTRFTSADNLNSINTEKKSPLPQYSK